MAALNLFRGEKRDTKIDIKTFKTDNDEVKTFTMDDAKNIIINNAFQSSALKDMARIASCILSNSGPLQLYLRASFLNHSCVNNCNRLVIGQHVLIYATKDI